MIKLLLLALIAAAPAIALVDLDQMMSENEKLKTGVATMTRDQKMELALWIEENFTPKVPTAPTPAPSSTSLYLSENISGGKQIRLSDGSLYDISPDDTEFTAFWITPFPIAISPSGDPIYPFLITNTNTGTSVKAKLSPPKAKTTPAPAVPIPSTPKAK
ncbi:MAG: hypothetical protein V4494_07050 [Chlamydiota bacterium]